MTKRVFFALLFVMPFSVFAQKTIDTSALKKQLASILARDQGIRQHDDSVKYWPAVDSANQAQVVAIIEKYGWPGKDFVGERGNDAVFLVIQHADLQLQEKYLPLMERSVKAGQSDAGSFAMLTDRVLMYQGKKQIYGSQVTKQGADGAWQFHPIEDEKNVNARRKAVGMEPIEEYAKYFGIEYKAKE